MPFQPHSIVRVAGAACLAFGVLTACQFGDDPQSRSLGSGLEDRVGQCVKACEVFATTGCNTRAARFCEQALDNCKARYRAHPKCAEQLAALDTCAAAQPAHNYSCPLGNVPDPARPYRVSEDVCVDEARAVSSCL